MVRPKYRQYTRNSTWSGFEASWCHYRPRRWSLDYRRCIKCYSTCWSCLLRKITLRLDNFFILAAVIVESLFYNQKRKHLVKNQWFIIGIITIFVIVISNAVIATLVQVDTFGIREIYQTKNSGGAVQEWYFNTDNPGIDPRTGGENPYTKFVQKNPDGSWKVCWCEIQRWLRS